MINLHRPANASLLKRIATKRLRLRLAFLLFNRMIAAIMVLAACHANWAWSQTNYSGPPVIQASHRHSAFGSEADVQWVDVGTAQSGYGCGCGNPTNCAVCQRTTPATVFMCPPPQPTGVTTGSYGSCISAVDVNSGPGERRWCDARGVNFEPLQHGEYIGPVRLPAMLEYRVRVNDEIIFTFIVNRQRTDEEYRLMVGDTININSVSDDSLRRENVQIQPDGTIIVPLVRNPIPASGKTIPQLRRDLEDAFKKYLNAPAINVEPLRVNTALEDLRLAVNPQFGIGGQSLSTIVNPDGRLQLPLIGSVFVLGMNLEEIKREVNLRYRSRVAGIEVEPRLNRLAPHNIFVFGEVNRPGRYEIVGPTTVTQGLALAEGLRLGANNRQIVIFRRAEDWRLVSTILDVRAGHLGKRPTPSDEIWLRDGDLIIVPPRPVRLFNNFVRQVFTEGVYGVVPFQGISIQNNN